MCFSLDSLPLRIMEKVCSWEEWHLRAQTLLFHLPTSFQGSKQLFSLSFEAELAPQVWTGWLPQPASRPATAALWREQSLLSIPNRLLRVCF